jgi:hypothetical protein
MLQSSQPIQSSPPIQSLPLGGVLVSPSQQSVQPVALPIAVAVPMSLPYSNTEYGDFTLSSQVSHQHAVVRTMSSSYDLHGIGDAGESTHRRMMGLLSRVATLSGVGMMALGVVDVLLARVSVEHVREDQLELALIAFVCGLSSIGLGLGTRAYIK